MHGRVLDSLGTPVSQCELVLAPLADPQALLSMARETATSRPAAGAPTSQIAKVRTDAAGHFALEITAREPFVLMLAHTDFPLRVAAYGLNVGNAEDQDLGDLVLHSEPGLLVDVFGGGSAIANARLELTPVLVDSDLPRSASVLQERMAVTDDRGRAVFYGIQPQLYRLRADAPGWASVLRGYEHAPKGGRAGEVRLDLMPGTVLRGRIRGPDGQPLCDAHIVAKSSATGAWQQGTSDDQGNFRIPGLATGSVEAWGDTREFGSTPPVTLELSAAGQTLELAYEPGAEISGRIVAGESGTPLGEASIRIVSRLDTMQNESEIQLPELRTSPTGTFHSQKLPSGEYSLVAIAPGRAPTEVRARIDSGVAPPPLTIRLVTSSACAGRIVDPNGRPVSGARITPVDAAYDGSAFARWVTDSRSKPASAFATSGSDGTFLLDGLGAGPLRLRVSSPGYPDWLSERIQVEPASRKEIGSLTLQHGGRVRGTAWLARGEPASGAIVALEPVPSQEPNPAHFARESRQVLADADGRFDLGLVGPGRYEMVYHVQSREPLAATAVNAAKTKVEIHVQPGSDLVQDLYRSPK